MTNITNEDLKKITGTDKRNPLHRAILSDNSTDLTNILNQDGLESDSILTALLQHDSQDYTPLALAVSEGRIDRVKAILNSDVVKSLPSEKKKLLFLPEKMNTSEYFEMKPTLFHMVINGELNKKNGVELYRFLYQWASENSVNCDDLFCHAHDHVPISVLHHPLKLRNGLIDLDLIETMLESGYPKNGVYHDLADSLILIHFYDNPKEKNKFYPILHMLLKAEVFTPEYLKEEGLIDLLVKSQARSLDTFKLMGSKFKYCTKQLLNNPGIQALAKKLNTKDPKDSTLHDLIHNQTTKDKIALNSLIDQLKAKEYSFDCSGKTTAKESIKTLIQTITDAAVTYFDNDVETPGAREIFKKTCTDAIDNARPELCKQRGSISQLLDKFILLLSKKPLPEGKYSFFKTDTAKKLNKVETLIKGIGPQ